MNSKRRKTPKIIIRDSFSKLNKEILLNKTINIYICGPTIYNHLHIGNVRGMIIIDVLNRILRFKKVRLKLVSNITDIDDKIIEKAIKENKSEKSIINYYLKEYKKLFKKLNIIKPSIMPRVLMNLNGMKTFISNLVKTKNAYENEGNVFFNTKNVKNYGNLGKLKVENQIIEADEFSKFKKNSQDFVLWKNTSKGISFNSKWGKGRPGWHTECAFFVSQAFKKQTIDIHFGGIDLIFPHHVNEKTQFECLYHKKMAKAWAHFGHVTTNNQKMSKSWGNVILVKDFLEKKCFNVLKNVFFSITHTKPLDFNEEIIKSSQLELKKWENSMQAIISVLFKNNVDLKLLNKNFYEKKELEKSINVFFNNLNIIEIKVFISRIFREINELKEINKVINKHKCKLVNTILILFDLLGFKYKMKISLLIKNKYLNLINKQDFIKADKLRSLFFCFKS